ncbi:MAG: NosD domain-containing protein [Planctomycetota bacterium]|jgi:parallel beta-helix repeat protein
MKEVKKISILLLTSIFAFAFNIQPVKAEEIIIIEPNGTVTPANAPISTEDEVTYTFEDNIDCNGIVVKKSGIIIDGNEFTLRGPGRSNGFDLTDMNNVRIQHTFIENFNVALLLGESYNNIICRNTIAGCDIGVKMTAVSNDSNNKFYHNNFIANTTQVYLECNPLLDCTNIWDDGYLSGGNYWSDHEFTDELNGPDQNTPGRDGICDTKYEEIDANNIDSFPLMEPYLLSVCNTEKAADYYTIQEAIDDANQGDTIHVFSGAHYENIGVAKPLQLIGDGASITIIDGIRKKSIQTYDDVVKIDANNTRIEGFRIQNAGDGYAGLNLSGFQYNQIISNTITNSPNGVRLDGSNYNTMVDNAIAFNTNAGIDINDSNNILISKNRIISNGGIGGVLIADSNTVRIINNTIASNFGGGISITGNSYNNEIRGNKVVAVGDLNADGSVDYGDVDKFALDWLTGRDKADLNPTGRVDFGDFALLAQNYLCDSKGSDGIVVQAPADANTTIVANTVTLHKIGIQLDGTSGNRITDNVLIHNNSGLVLSSASDNVIVNNVARGNNNDGIYLNDSSNVSITGNDIFNNTRGIRLQTIFYTLSNNVSITENKIHDNDYEGIELNYCQDCNIMGNFITRNNTGILLDWDCYDGTIRKNRIKSNSGYGIKIHTSNCEGNKIYHNVFLKNNPNAEDGNSDLNQWYHDYQCGPNSLSGGNFWDDYIEVVEQNPVDDCNGLDQTGPDPDFGNCSKYGIADVNYPVDGDTTDEYPLVLVGAKITTSPVMPKTWPFTEIPYPIPAESTTYTPKMGRPYIVDVNLHNTAGDLASTPNSPADSNVYYGGIKQVDPRPGSWLEWIPDLPGFGWPLNYNTENEPCDPPFGIKPAEVNEFNPIFTNNWDWIIPNDWKGVVISIIGAIPKLPGATGVSVGSFILSCYNASKAVPTMTYTFEHMEETEGASDIIIFSKDVTIKVPIEKLAYLNCSLAMQVYSIECSILATVCLASLVPQVQALAPAYWVASAAFTAGSIVTYYMAEDPSENYTEIFQPLPVPVPGDVNDLEEGVAKRLALAVLDMVALEHAYGESYIRYDYATRADNNEPNECYMGLQLGAALNYNAMATDKLQDVQFLTGILTLDPCVPEPTLEDVNDFRNDIDVNGLPQIQKEILDVFDFNEPTDPNDPNAADVREVMLALTDPCDPNMVELRQLCTEPDNLHKHLQTIIQGRYIAEHALEVAAEAENLTELIKLLYASNVTITDVWSDATEVMRSSEVKINSELENHGTEAATFDVNAYAGTNTEPNLFFLGTKTVTLASGAKKSLTFIWDTANVSVTGYYRVKAEADIVAGENFIADNKHTGGTVRVWIPADTTAPSVPSLSGYITTETTVWFSWPVSTGDPTGYKVYRDEALIWAGWCGSVTPSYTDTGLLPATTYTYRVSAYDAAGNESNQSNELTAITSGP